MVEKRVLTFALLAVLVWAVLASCFAGYYSLEVSRLKEKLDKNKQVIDDIAQKYDDSISRYTLLLTDYSTVYGSYSLHSGENFTDLMPSFGKLLESLKGNYSSLLNESTELNESYAELNSEYQTLLQGGNVTVENFGNLLDNFYKLFSLLALRGMQSVMENAFKITVNLCIDYGNGTVKWFNETEMPPGSSLFNLLTKVANVKYTYWPALEPGHILIDSINGVGGEKGRYWLWYYWNNKISKWVFGPVGCDAWPLENNGTYKFVYT